jgi:hypothetical protein
MDGVTITDRSMEFHIIGDNIYKAVNIQYNPSHIVSRLMMGDLYDCLMILRTNDISKYGDFLDYSKRIMIETAIESIVKSDSMFSQLRIGIHPILDVNKTERQINVLLEGRDEEVVVGDEASRCLLLGIFLKNDPYGLSRGKVPFARYRSKLCKTINEYFASYFEEGIAEITLYEEVDKYGK